MIQAGIVGGAGYAGGELIRLLLHHSEVNISYVLSNSQSGKKLFDVHHDLLGQTEKSFVGKLEKEVDVLFICSGHGKSRTFLEQNQVNNETIIIDLSRDYRLKSNAEEFVYGLCELNKNAIRKASKISNCGCFATCIQLGLLPAAKAGILKSDIHVNAITGSTGAGQSKSDTTHFSWRNNNISVYKAFRHQHLDEIVESVKQEDPQFDNDINFLPVRGNFTRGIYASSYFRCNKPLEEIKSIYKDYYSDSPFVHISDRNPSLKEVVNTNMAYIHLDRIDDKLLIICMLDNLLKGAAGQAVQNMNLAFDLDERSGLNLKAAAF